MIPMDMMKKMKKMKNVLKWYKRKKLFGDKSNFVMESKLIEVAKEVKRSDGWWGFACGDVFFG